MIPMRPRFVGKILFALLLVTGLSIGDDRRQSLEGEAREREEGYRRVGVADCTFEKNPDSFLGGVRRTLEELSSRTERIVRGGAVGLSAPPRGEQGVAFVNDIPSRGYIDDYIFGRMRQDNVPHSALASDAEYMRRVSLDLTGRIPGAADVRSFLNSDDPKKRSNLIQSLLNSSEFVDKWTMFFGDLLHNTSNDTNVNRYPDGRNAFYRSIRSFLEDGTPYDVFVRKLITGSGNSFTDADANWSLGSWTPMGPIQDTYDTLVVRSATQFLGLSNMDCLLCHSGAGHLDKLNVWATGVARSQAWEMAAFFARTRMTRSPQQPNGTYYWTISDLAAGNYALNTTAGNRTPRQPVNGSNQVMPRYLFSGEQASGNTYREMFANNLTEDRQFARATVNYLWREMMGIGIVEPADQFDLARQDPVKVPSGWTLQPSHPQLLESLADDFIRSGYSIRFILGLIADSNAYQISSRFPGEWRVEYSPYFARKFVRRLWAEEVHDAITTATRVMDSLTVAGFPAPVQWAMQLPEPGNNRGAAGGLLDVFLRGDRDQNPRSDQPTILQSMAMMNNNFVLSRIRNSNVNSAVSKLLSNGDLTDNQVIEELFLGTLGRFPTAKEMAGASAALKANRIAGAENLHWALLNKIDFLYNY